MARSDYERPAAYQVTKIYACQECGHEVEEPAVSQSVPEICQACGGQMIETGESYPADPDEWDEVRLGGEWLNKKNIRGPR